MNRCIVNSSGTPPIRQRPTRPPSSIVVTAGGGITTPSVRMKLWVGATLPTAIGTADDVIADRNPSATGEVGLCATSATTARSSGNAGCVPSAKPLSVSPWHCVAKPQASTKSIFSGSCRAHFTTAMPEAFAPPNRAARKLDLILVPTMSMPSVLPMSMPRALRASVNLIPLKTSRNPVSGRTGGVKIWCCLRSAEFTPLQRSNS